MRVECEICKGRGYERDHFYPIASYPCSGCAGKGYVWGGISIGTKSILFGAHAFWLHPWFVAWAWWRLYGFPWHPLLWVSFFVHDIGYWGLPNMDGEEGERHVLRGGLIMRFFGWKWFDFCTRHSRYFCKSTGVLPSRLCYADKLSIYLTPSWIYVPMVRLTGEIKEYREVGLERAAGEPVSEYEWSLMNGTDWEWYRGLRVYMWRWVVEHVNNGGDTWTKERS